MPLFVSVETNRPRAATPISDAATTSAMRKRPPQPLGEADPRPGDGGQFTQWEEQGPHGERRDRHHQRRDQAERHRGRVLRDQQAGPAGGGDEEIAQGAGVRLARDRVARDDTDRHRQEEGERRGERREHQEQAVVGDLCDEGRSLAASAARGRAVTRLYLDGDTDENRYSRQHAQQCDGPPPPEGRDELAAEESERPQRAGRAPDIDLRVGS